MLRSSFPLRQFGGRLGLLFLLTCSTCSREEPQDLELYQQRLVGSPYVLYAFRYPGQFVTTSDYRGWTLLDSSTTFAQEHIAQLPTQGNLLLGPPAPDSCNRVSSTRRPTGASPSGSRSTT
jgi:hypothetical protein